MCRMNTLSKFSIHFPLVLVTLFYCCLATAKAERSGSCATLFQHENYKGSNLSISDGEQITDFGEHYIGSTELWNVTRSIKTRHGCAVTLCSDSYFDGVCKVFKKNDSPSRRLAPELRKIRSANCTCPTVCQCGDIQLRRSECARAYVETTCNSCNAYYMDFRGEKPFVEEKIKSIVIRPGCELEVFDEEEFDGSSFLHSGIIEDWEEEIGSYNCTCNGEYEKPRKLRRDRPSSYPQFVNVPDSADAIKSMLKEMLGHPGLISSLQSIKSKRSPKNAYIILLGLTGAGKSSAINLLFDNPNVTKVGSGSSVTSDIHEFRIPIAVDELGLANSELRVIDTPGLGDTRGLEQDARFLTTLEEYLSRHEELSKYIPNVVLVFGKFNDNRFHGVGSNYVKMLRGIDTMQSHLTDKKFSNVIFVLSHFLSEIKETVRKPGKRLAAFKKTIEDFTLFPKPISIVVAENKAQEEGLPMLNGYYKLPNGDFYPRNLFDKIQAVTSSGGDPIGEAVIRAAFRDSDNFNVSSSSTPLVPSTHGKVLKYLGILTDSNFQMNDTDISRLLEIAYEGINDTMKWRYPDALRYIQRALYLRNIVDKNDIPRTTVGILELLKEIRLNEVRIRLIEKGLNLKIPSIPVEIIKAGFGYNAVEDLPIRSSPFIQNKEIITDIVYKVPDFLSCRIQNEKKSFYKVFKNTEGYVGFRLQSLDVEHKSNPVTGYHRKPKPGYNIIAEAKDEYVVSSLREYRTFELVLNDNWDLKDSFISDARNLPLFNQSDYDGIEIWKEFFKKYGTHVVKSVHGGGSIEIQLKTKDSSSQAVAAAMYNILELAEDLTLGIGKLDSESGENLTSSHNYQLKFGGGDFKYQVTTFSGMSIAAAANVMGKWKDSLQYNPVILDNDINLLPISEVGRVIGNNISSEIQRAAFALFNSTLVYRPPEEYRPPPPDPREMERQQIADIKKADKDFSAIMDLVRQDFRNSNARYIKLMTDLRENSRARAASWQREIEEEEKWQRAREAKLRANKIEDLLREERRIRELELHRRRMREEIERARRRG